MSKTIRRVHLRITGRVQGVYYRASMVKQARLIGLKGWVKNMHDGTVEAMIQGKAGTVDKLVQWCSYGPPGARVRAVSEREEVPDDNLKEFKITW